MRGDYCYHCGQRNQQVIGFFPTLVLEAFEGLFAFESRTWRSIWLLFSRPAWLTREYLAGRRIRYLPPLRLFFAFLLAFLFAVSVEMFLDSIGIDIDSEPVVAGQDVSDETLGEDELVEFRTELQKLADRLQIPFLSAENNRKFVALLQDRAIRNFTAIREDPLDFVDQLLEYLPVLLLVMMPVLALIQKIVYIRSGRYYIEHLLLSIQNHSFLFLTFILVFLLDLIIWLDFGILPAIAGFLRILLNLWTVAYLYLSLRQFFGQGYLLTGLKFVSISLTYGIVLLTGILLFSLIGFFVY